MCIIIHISEISYLNIMEDILEYLFFSDTEMWIRVIRMRTWMDKPIHVQIQVIKFRNLKSSDNTMYKF